MNNHAEEVKTRYNELEILRKRAKWASGDYSLLMVAGLMVTAEATADAFKRVEARLLEAEATVKALTKRVAELESKPAEKWSLK